jgi:ketosteroid isomerase-like protein
MPQVKKHALFAGSADDLETAFYEALQAADIEKLMDCWADEDEIVCVHPGSPRLVGHGAIRAAFDAMFGSGNLRVRPEGIRRVEALGCAVHSVRERVEILTNEGPREAFVLATNVYHKTAHGWRMVAHHASPGPQDDVQDTDQQPTILH